jgi:mannose-6-phosphate isomerase-like protein (cupin superfamily)
VSYHDLSVAPLTPMGGLKMKGFVGRSGTFVFAELRRALNSAAHHHDQEQVNVVLGGMIQLAIGGTPHSLGTYAATLVPSNVEHALSTPDADAIATAIEFQPVQRPDLFPPFPTNTLPSSPAAIALLPERQVATDFAASSNGWEIAPNGARSKTLRGLRTSVTMWDLSEATAVGNLKWTKDRSEQFAYVVDGRAEVVEGKARRTIGPQMLVVITRGGPDVHLRSVGKGHTLILVFES